MGTTLNKVVFQPPPPTYTEDKNLLWLTTKNGKTIPAFFINRGAKLTILFSHGNAEDLGMIVNYFREFANLFNVNIFGYEYTGYGRSKGGHPSEVQVYADAEAAFEYLTNSLPVSPWDVVLYGRSLGSGAACHLAVKYGQYIRGLILQSPLMSVHRIVLNLRFTLPGDMFCNIDKISRVRCPTYIVHGTKDEVIPVSHGMELYNACRYPVTPYWVEGAGHNDLETTGKGRFYENFMRYIKFLETTQSQIEFKQGSTRHRDQRHSPTATTPPTSEIGSVKTTATTRRSETITDDPTSNKHRSSKRNGTNGSGGLYKRLWSWRGVSSSRDNANGLPQGRSSGLTDETIAAQVTYANGSTP